MINPLTADAIGRIPLKGNIGLGKSLSSGERLVAPNDLVCFVPSATPGRQPAPSFFYSPRHFGAEFQLPAEIDFSRILLPGASAFNRFTLFSWKGEGRAPRLPPKKLPISAYPLSNARPPAEVFYDYDPRDPGDGSSESEVCPGLDYRSPSPPRRNLPPSPLTETRIRPGFPVTSRAPSGAF